METPTEFPQKSRRGRILAYVLLGLLGLLLILLLTVFAAVQYSLDKLNRPDPSETYISEEDLLLEQAGEEPLGDFPAMDPGELELPEAGGLIGQEDDILNVLLIGQDRRPGEGRARSDAMILCSVNKTDGTIYLISFLRDLYVAIPEGYSDNRLNAAYALGGFRLLDAALEQNFGIRVDANIEVDFSGFESAVDLLGGVDVSLTEAEADYLGLWPGMNHMDGAQALAYSRIRYLDSDFGRTNRQRNVLTAMIAQLRNVDLASAKALVDELFPLVTTDMTNMQILDYMTWLLPMLSSAEVRALHIPADETYYYATIRGMSVLVPDLEANQALLLEALGQ